MRPNRFMEEKAECAWEMVDGVASASAVGSAQVGNDRPSRRCRPPAPAHRRCMSTCTYTAVLMALAEQTSAQRLPRAAAQHSLVVIHVGHVTNLHERKQPQRMTTRAKDGCNDVHNRRRGTKPNTATDDGAPDRSRWESRAC